MVEVNIHKKIEYKPLHCPLCNVKFMNIYGQPLPNHTQLKCITDNNNEINIGVCNKCSIGDISIEICNEILEGIKNYWYHDIDINKNINSKDKSKRKEYHGSHNIIKISKISNTVDDAEINARSGGVLI